MNSKRRKKEVESTEPKTKREKELEDKVLRLVWLLQGKDEQAMDKAVAVFRFKVRTLCPCISRHVVESVLSAVCSVAREDDLTP
jgi:hypothetical protein